MTTDDFINKARLTHGNRYDYALVEYNRSTHPVNIICRQHGSFYQRPDVHLRGRNCPICGYNQRASTRKEHGDWLPFAEARDFVRHQQFATIADWNVWCKLHRPPNIPACPKVTYKNEWLGWGDWLGNFIEWLPFNEARDIARMFGLRSREDWNFFCNALHKKPKNIPFEPNNVYKNEWLGWGDWLGYSSRANGNLAGVVYVIQQSNLPSTVYKVGRTYRLDKRIYEHKRVNNTDITVIRTYHAQNMKIAEAIAHTSALLHGKRYQYHSHVEYFEIGDIDTVLMELDELLT